MSPVLKVFIVTLFFLFVAGDAVANQKVNFETLASHIKSNRTKDFRESLSRFTKEDINFSGRALLISLAISERHADAIAALADWGVDFNISFPVRSEEGIGGAGTMTPLVLAISSHAGLPVIEMLVRCGADIEKASDTLQPLGFALATRQYDVADYLLERGANPNQSGSMIMNSFMELAISWPDSDSSAAMNALKKLISSGGDINAKGKRGLTALSLAVNGGRIHAVRALLENGADPNTVNEKGESALLIARKKQREDIATLLIEKGARP